MVKQFSGIRKRFNSFGEFGASTLPEMFADGLLDDATVLSFNYMQSSWVENLGDGTFKMHALPKEAQLAPIYGILAEDLDHDGLLDLLLIGNDYGMEVQQGPADAFQGLVLMNKGGGKFRPASLEESHFFVPGDARSLATINIGDKKSMIVASQNNDRLRVFEKPEGVNTRIVKLQDREVKCHLYLDDSQYRVQEFYRGSTFQSQSGRFVIAGKEISRLQFFDSQGKETRMLSLD